MKKAPAKKAPANEEIIEAPTEKNARPGPTRPDPGAPGPRRRAAERLVGPKLPQHQQRGPQEPKTIAESAAAAESASEDATDANEEQ